MRKPERLFRQRPRQADPAPAPPLPVGTRIDFGDPGEGVIEDRDGDRVFLRSPVFTGWMREADLWSMIEAST